MPEPLKPNVWKMVFQTIIVVTAILAVAGVVVRSQAVHVTQVFSTSKSALKMSDAVLPPPTNFPSSPAP